MWVAGDEVRMWREKKRRFCAHRKKLNCVMKAKWVILLHENLLLFSTWISYVSMSLDERASNGDGGGINATLTQINFVCVAHEFVTPSPFAAPFHAHASCTSAAQSFRRRMCIRLPETVLCLPSWKQKKSRSTPSTRHGTHLECAANICETYI